MSVLFNAANKFIKFTAPTNVLGLTQKTITFNLNYISSNAADSFDIFKITDGTGTDSDEVTYVYMSGRKLTFLTHWSLSDGNWETQSTIPPSSSTIKIAITYNASATSNVPIIYVDNSVKTITGVTPTGTFRSGTSTDLYLGSKGASPVFSASISDIRVYNVIKTAAQVSAIYNEDLSTDQNIDETGLVFHAPLTMCKGLSYSTFAGSTLAAANEFYDRINGYTGVPSGSPVGA